MITYGAGQGVAIGTSDYTELGKARVNSGVTPTLSCWGLFSRWVCANASCFALLLHNVQINRLVSETDSTDTPLMAALEVFGWWLAILTVSVLNYTN